MKQEIIDQLQVGLELKKSGVVLKWGDSKEAIEAKSPSSIDYLAAQKLTRYIWDQEIVFVLYP